MVTQSLKTTEGATGHGNPVASRGTRGSARRPAAADSEGKGNFSEAFSIGQEIRQRYNISQVDIIAEHTRTLEKRPS